MPGESEVAPRKRNDVHMSRKKEEGGRRKEEGGRRLYMYINHAGMAQFIRLVKSGVLQGCPLATLLFVIAMEQFLVMFNTAVESAGLGIVRACADDVALVLKDFSSFSIVYKIFKLAEIPAGLTLKVQKCFIISLATCSDSRLLQSLQKILRQNIPTWGKFSHYLNG